MSDLERLEACLDDAQQILSIRSEEHLHALFRTSKTGISDAFDGGVDGLISRWEGHDMEDIRAYLLWDYIAYNIAELYNSYDLARQVLEKGLKDRDKT